MLFETAYGVPNREPFACTVVMCRQPAIGIRNSVYMEYSSPLVLFPYVVYCPPDLDIQTPLFVLLYRFLGVPKAFQAVLQQKSPTSLVSKVGKALQFILGPAPRSTSVASSLSYYASPAIATVLVLTGVLGGSFGPAVLDALG